MAGGNVLWIQELLDILSHPIHSVVMVTVLTFLACGSNTPSSVAITSPEDASIFAEQILTYANLNLTDREISRISNRQIIESRGDWDRNFCRLLELYKKVV